LLPDLECRINYRSLVVGAHFIRAPGKDENNEEQRDKSERKKNVYNKSVIENKEFMHQRWFTAFMLRKHLSLNLII